MSNMAFVKLLYLTLFSGLLYLKTIDFSYCQSDVNVVCLKNERHALLKFKEGIIDPSGLLSSWIGEDCCRWRGVSCDNRTRHVVELKLGNPYPNPMDANETLYELGGKIDPSLLQLRNLTYLDLSMNNFEGIQIPNFIGSLKKLKYLNLSGASFGGMISPSLGNLSSLQYLDLSIQFKEPTYSNLLWVANLSSLKYLNLGGVNLTKASSHWLQIINKLPSLVELHLYQCGLSNLQITLPSINFTSLSVLDLSENDFNSTTPHWLFNLSSLQYIDLRASNLIGELVDEFANLGSLQHLDLSENTYFGGKLSRHFGKLCNLRILKLSVTGITGEVTDFIDGLSECSNNSLETLGLEYSQLGGNLPVSLGYLKNLRFLHLRQNSFIGPIPQSIGNLSQLEELYLSRNQMKGSIPESLGQLSSLVVLDLSENEWEGVVTEGNFANLSSLEQLDLYKLSLNVTLVFNISFDWIPPFKLSYLRIRSCQLGPKFPTWLRNQNKLTTLLVNEAQISDTIPDWFWQLGLEVDELDFAYNQLSGRIPNTVGFLSATTVDLSFNNFEGPLPLWSAKMERLYLPNNRFSGSIPDNIGEVMPSLTDLEISWNSLIGSIPNSIGNMKGLISLVVSNNNLSGEIPLFWINVPFLSILDASNNSLSGKIPWSIGSLSNLKFLVLSNNNLSGKLPSSMQNCSSLYSLDLGNNKFSGNLPSWIGKSFKDLLILSLRFNSFRGNIPQSSCSLSNLHILDLSHNNLSGKIPPCVGNLTGLKIKLTDEDTEKYQGQLRLVSKGRQLEYSNILYLVNSLDLSGNVLSGEIPVELTKLVELGTLNLSMNNLTGSIPLEIGSLRQLETLDLSINNLSGTIPPSMAQLTFLAHLNLSYNNLSGQIPTTNQFQTFNDPSTYEGNVGLCGLPLPVNCSKENEKSPFPDEENDVGDGDDLDKLWFFVTIGSGFTVGFWGVCGSLILIRSWRIAYFRFIDRKKDAVLVIFSIYAARVKEMFSSFKRSQQEM